jgi:hypothetical protein
MRVGAFARSGNRIGSHAARPSARNSCARGATRFAGPSTHATRKLPSSRIATEGFARGASDAGTFESGSAAGTRNSSEANPPGQPTSLAYTCGCTSRSSCQAITARAPAPATIGLICAELAVSVFSRRSGPRRFSSGAFGSTVRP